jgi:hypothetical protein
VLLSTGQSHERKFFFQLLKVKINPEPVLLLEIFTTEVIQGIIAVIFKF